MKMFRFRRELGDGEVEAVKLFLAGDEISSGGARFCLWRREGRERTKSLDRRGKGIFIAQVKTVRPILSDRTALALSSPHDTCSQSLKRWRSCLSDRGKWGSVTV